MAQKKLIKGFSTATIGKNISYEMNKHKGMSNSQAVAIALATARSAAAKAGKKGIVKKLTPPKGK